VYILPRILRDINTIDTRTTVFGSKTCLPIAFAPGAMQKLAGGEGELDVARTASNMGSNMTLSSQFTTSLEEVTLAAKSQAAGGVLSPKLWFQIYMAPDMNHNIVLIKRAEGTVPMTVGKAKLGEC
jgi:(S)-2-hydroxy-acid oxidase